jgi:hypothetical protein
MPLQHFSSKPHAKDKHGGSQGLVLQEKLACEAKEHGHDLKQKTSSGRTNNSSKGVDERVWAVQPRGVRGHKVTKKR